MNDSPELREKIFNLFPLFRQAGQDVTAELFQHSKLAELPADQLICMEGNKCSCIPLVLEGRARVYKLSESGREITLYHVEPGESCIMTASCILSGVEFPAYAATETAVKAIVIPPEILHRWVNEYEVWRRFLCGMLASRLAEVIAVVEEVAFKRVDIRAAEYLLKVIDKDGAILKTHQSIATDIGTSREVISRILKDFEHKGLVCLSRGKIQPEKVELQRFAHETAARMS